METDELYKNHILEAITTIQEFITDKTFDDLVQNKLLQAGVVHELQIIGEAVKRLSRDFRTRYHLPWEDIAGTRDKIVHDYFKVDLKVVWDTVQTDLPKLKSTLEK